VNIEEGFMEVLMGVVFPMFLLLGGLACDGDSPSAPEESTAPAAASAEPPPPPADVDVALPALPEGPQVAVQLDGSSIQFTGAKITGSHDGGFDAFTGSIVMDGEQVSAASFTIDMNSTNSDHPKLTKHLKSKDFFHTEKYPQAQFVSVKVEAQENPGAVTHKIDGVLSMHGKTRPLAFPATVTVGESATTVTASFDINRQNWGVAYPGKPDDLIKDDVQIRLNLSFPTQAE
jgi:polyisoprenoid-binding protein YceI